MAHHPMTRARMSATLIKLDETGERALRKARRQALNADEAQLAEHELLHDSDARRDEAGQPTCGSYRLVESGCGFEILEYQDASAILIVHGQLRCAIGNVALARQVRGRLLQTRIAELKKSLNRRVA